MSEQYPGGYVTKSPVVPDGTTAPGLWNLSQQAYYQSTGTWPPVLPPDPQFNYVTMLLHGDGTNGAQNNTFLDSGPNTYTITRNGNTTQGSFSPYGSNWSTNFVPAAGLGDQLTVGNATNLQFGTGDFTFEAWVNTNGYGNYQTLYDKGYGASGSFLIQMSTDYKPFVYSSGGFLMTSSTAFAVDTWNHFAVVRSGSTMTMYINGVSVASVSNSTNFNDASNIAVGARYADRTYPWSGYISNLRLVKGTAVYTSAFTPPTAPLTAISGTSLLISQSNRFIDNSGNGYTVAPVGSPSVQRFNPFGTSTAYSTATIGGSGFFDGSGDYLSIASASALQLSSSNFTIELFLYLPVVFPSDYSVILGKGYNNTSTEEWYLEGMGAGYINLFYSTNGTSYNQITITPALTAGQWYHIALCRSGSNFACFTNGTRTYSDSGFGATLYSGNGPVQVGGYNDGSLALYTKCYQSSVRIVKGSAVYDPTQSTITVPTAPLTAVTNTSLLLNMTNGAIYDNAMMSDFWTQGNAQISTSVKKYGTGSLYFDGNTAATTGLRALANPSMDFNNGPFTIEAWVNFNNASDYFIIAARLSSSGSGDWSFFYNYTILKWRIVGGSGASIIIDMSNTWTPTVGTWYHVAVCRSGNNFYFFINGVQQGTTQVSSATFPYTPSYATTVGIFQNDDNSTNGYIDDLRITKGYARYTTNFTPPTAALPNIGPT